MTNLIQKILLFKEANKRINNYRKETDNLFKKRCNEVGFIKRLAIENYDKILKCEIRVNNKLPPAQRVYKEMQSVLFNLLDKRRGCYEGKGNGICGKSMEYYTENFAPVKLGYFYLVDEDKDKESYSILFTQKGRELAEEFAKIYYDDLKYNSRLNL